MAPAVKPTITSVRSVSPKMGIEAKLPINGRTGVKALALSLAVGTLAFLLTAFLRHGPEAATLSGWTARIVSLWDTRNRSP